MGSSLWEKHVKFFTAFADDGKLLNRLKVIGNILIAFVPSNYCIVSPILETNRFFVFLLDIKPLNFPCIGQ